MNQMSDKEAALSEFWEAFKEANGFRPRGILYPSHLTADEIDAKTVELYRQADAEAAVNSGNADWIDERDRPSVFEEFFGE